MVLRKTLWDQLVAKLPRVEVDEVSRIIGKTIIEALSVATREVEALEDIVEMFRETMDKERTERALRPMLAPPPVLEYVEREIQFYIQHLQKRAPDHAQGAVESLLRPSTPQEAAVLRFVRRGHRGAAARPCTAPTRRGEGEGLDVRRRREDQSLFGGRGSKGDGTAQVLCLDGGDGGSETSFSDSFGSSEGSFGGSGSTAAVARGGLQRPSTAGPSRSRPPTGCSDRDLHSVFEGLDLADSGGKARGDISPCKKAAGGSSIFSVWRLADKDTIKPLRQAMESEKKALLDYAEELRGCLEAEHTQSVEEDTQRKSTLPPPLQDMRDFSSKLQSEYMTPTPLMLYATGDHTPQFASGSMGMSSARPPVPRPPMRAGRGRSGGGGGAGMGASERPSSSVHRLRSRVLTHRTSS